MQSNTRAWPNEPRSAWPEYKKVWLISAPLFRGAPLGSEAFFTYHLFVPERGVSADYEAMILSQDVTERRYVISKEPGGWSIIRDGERSAVFPNREAAVLAVLDRACDDFCRSLGNGSMKVVLQDEHGACRKIIVESTRPPD